MKERPILFSGPMVRALLTGTKTQTRRAVKITHRTPGLAACLESRGFKPDLMLAATLCPYGQPGDRLWVRETFKEAHPVSFQPGRVGERRLYAGIPGPPPVDYLVAYRADGELLPYWHSDEYPYRALRPRDDLDLKFNPRGCETGWDSPIHMPRTASRLTLEITAVRVERLQDISSADAIAEGLDFVPDGAAAHGIKGLATSWSNDPRKSYRALWESLNGDGSWDANPWVWVIESKRVTA